MKRSGWLVSTRDVRAVAHPAIESDCACAVSSPALDSNCACPVDGWDSPIRRRPQLDGIYRLPQLHIEYMEETDTYLAFNPLGTAGVVVFDSSVMSILLDFKQPRTLDSYTSQALDSSEEGLELAGRLAELDLLQLVGQAPSIQMAQPQTLTAWLHVTNACNLRCSYCYIQKTPDKMDIEHGIQSVDAVFRSAQANGFRRIKLKYAGGESSLNFSLVLALHKYAQQRAAESGIIVEGVVLSNGVAWGHAMICSLREHGLRLMISLDGIEEQHDVQRPFLNGRGSFSHVERTLDRLAEHGVVPSISVTISNRNLIGLSATVAYIMERQLPFTLNFYRENDCSTSFIDLSYQDDAIIEAMRRAFAEIERRLPPYSLLDCLIDRARLDAPHSRPCGVGQSYLVIDQHGGIAKCQMEIERTVTDVSVPDPLRLIREDSIGVNNPSVDEKEGCRECHWRYWCAGGCPALTYRVTGRYDVKSPNCNIYQTLFPEILRLEALRLVKYAVN